MKRWVGLALSGVALATGAGAQTHVVKKPETVVRAVGVYEWTGELGKATASRFVPVTVFIDNQLQDAGFYLARPVPFALETGTLFEVDKSGVPDGTLELAYQRHLVAGSASGGSAEIDGGWLAYGAYKAPPVAKVSTPKKSGPLSKVEVSGGKSDSGGPTGGPKFGKTPDAAAKDPAKDPDRPTMRKKTDSDADSSKTTSTPSTASTPADDPDRPTMKRKTDADTTTASSTDDADKPTMKKKPDSDSTASNDDADKPTMKRKTDADSTDSTASGGENDPERPTLRKRTPEQRQGARKERDSASVTGIGSLNDDPDRPNLHRGKPVSRMQEEELPPLQGTPPDMKQMVAVSDAKNRDTHDFTRAWEDDAERVAVLGKMQAMARAKLAEYDGKQVVPVPAPTAKPAAVKTATKAGVRPVAKKSVAKKTAAPAVTELTDEVLKGFTLSYGGAATYFYSATSTGANGVVRYVTVVAQQEPAGELKVALASLTDSTHLDRTPWMRLVDVVDVEASNRASLLMELRAQHSRQFALYRVIGAQAEQRFISGSTE